MSLTVRDLVCIFPVLLTTSHGFNLKLTTQEALSARSFAISYHRRHWLLSTFFILILLLHLLLRIHVRLDLANDACRIPSNDMERRDVLHECQRTLDSEQLEKSTLSLPAALHNLESTYLCHHRACADSTSPSNCHTWQNRRIATDPAVLANVDLSARLGALCPIADLWV